MIGTQPACKIGLYQGRENAVTLICIGISGEISLMRMEPSREQLDAKRVQLKEGTFSICLEAEQDIETIARALSTVSAHYRVL